MWLVWSYAPLPQLLLARQYSSTQTQAPLFLKLLSWVLPMRCRCGVASNGFATVNRAFNFNQTF